MIDGIGDCREENHRTEGPDLNLSENSSRAGRLHWDPNYLTETHKIGCIYFNSTLHFCSVFRVQLMCPITVNNEVIR